MNKDRFTADVPNFRGRTLRTAVHDLGRHLGETQEQILRWEFELIPWILEHLPRFLCQGKSPNAIARKYIQALILGWRKNPNSFAGRGMLRGIEPAPHVKNCRGHD